MQRVCEKNALFDFISRFCWQRAFFAVRKIPLCVMAFFFLLGIKNGATGTLVSIDRSVAATNVRREALEKGEVVCVLKARVYQKGTLETKKNTDVDAYNAMSLALSREVRATPEQLQQILTWAHTEGDQNDEPVFLYLLGAYYVRGLGIKSNQAHTPQKKGLFSLCNRGDTREVNKESNTKQGQKYLQRAADKGHSLAKICLDIAKRHYTTTELAIAVGDCGRELARRIEAVGRHVAEELHRVISGIGLSGSNFQYSLKK